MPTINHKPNHQSLAKLSPITNKKKKLFGSKLTWHFANWFAFSEHHFISSWTNNSFTILCMCKQSMKHLYILVCTNNYDLIACNYGNFRIVMLVTFSVVGRFKRIRRKLMCIRRSIRSNTGIWESHTRRRRQKLTINHQIFFFVDWNRFYYIQLI
jgi:hypothetical protein